MAEALLDRGIELWNVYGPTETAVWSAAGQVAAGEGPVLLGPPIANTGLHVVDRQLGLVPLGVAGELLIGGAGLARGYLGRPDLTAERFVPHPFAAVPGARIYRTGDLVRYRETGELELQFLGRIDHQVKVRGFRIELGEIEAALGRHPAVRQAVVVVRADGAVGSLVAYLVADGTPAIGELRDFLRQILPEYMVPAAFVILESLPLTPSGKVDRKALPAPQAGSAEAAHLKPEGPVEELVAAIWAEVLHRERVGAEESFFDLGGHSLLATQVASRLRAALGIELPLRSLFEAPTVRAFSRAVERARQEGGTPPLPPITPAPRGGGALPLSYAQERMWFLHQLNPELTAYNINQVIRLRGEVDVRALEGAFTTVVRRHESLRTVFVAEDGEPRQIVLAPAPVSLIRVDLRGIAADRREREAGRCTRVLSNQPFGLATGPLFQAALIEIAEDDRALLVLMHHIVSDAWSMRRMAAELAALYAAEREGRPAPLPELPIQYADFAAWQRRWLTAETLDAQLAYWTRQLAGAPPLLELPMDRPRPAVYNSRGARRRFEAGPEILRQVKEMGRRCDLTPFMVLLAVFETVLWRYTSVADLVVGVPIANRNRAEIEPLIGTFVNMLALRTRLSGETATFRELCAQIREVALDAFAHQDLPFERLVDELQPDRSLSHSPVFQVMFNLQNQPMARLDLPGLSFIPMPADRTQAQVDLTLAAGETYKGDRLVGFFEFNADLFDAATIERLSGHFNRLLASATAGPEQPLSALPLLGEEERWQLLGEWSDTAEERAPELLIHELFTR
ncbi:MAG TPA: condensation domain-containing protein, partial [Thermoanaerobaculia bacterium]